MSDSRQIKFYGSPWCPASRRAKRFLIDNGVSFEWINIDDDFIGREYVMSVNNGYRSVPTILFPDGEILVEPSNDTLVAKLQRIGVLV